MSANTIIVLSMVVGFVVCMALLAAGQWNVWTFLGASFWSAGTLGALEWNRQTREAGR